MISFFNLLDKDDFSAEVDKLAGAFRKTHGLGKVHQLGLVVPEVEEAAKSLEDKVGPFFVASGKTGLWRERGSVRDFHGKMGLAYYKGHELELLEQGQGSDFYRRCLGPAGEIRVQHLGFLCRDVDREAKRLESAGFPVYVRGLIKSGPLKIDFAYMDTEKEAGYIIEFISWKFAEIPVRPSPALTGLMARLLRLFGKRSLPL